MIPANRSKAEPMDDFTYRRASEEDEAAVSKRDIPRGYSYDPKALKPMARMLWALSVSLGHALTAYREFTRLKSSTISPDGMLGGRGYVMAVKDVRSKLYEACEALSAISDTVHDEINASHWKPQLAELNENDAEDFKRLLDESNKRMENPEEEAEEKLEKIEKANDAKWKARGVEPDQEPASQLPGGRSYLETNETFRPMKKEANSTIPVDCTPGGPRVNHLDRCEGLGPYGSYNRDEPPGRDDWSQTEGVGNEYLYESDWSNDTHREAASALPEDPTRTEAEDFGLGFGARGQGSKGYGTLAPDGHGVFGPASGLPDDPGGKVKSLDSDTTPALALHLMPTLNVWAASSVLPNDFEPPVARSDYYRGPKGNTISQEVSQEVLAESTLPGDSVSYNYDRSLPNTGYVFERIDNPYIKFDYTTKNYRPDATFERRPERPYTR